MHVVSTAGHVDHGKSALVRALTGIEPDRLAEEQARGLTIDLGYAWMTLPSGEEIGIVDVPGHERFISTMLAGAGQSDVVMFVVDANEGWKPQSEEHLQILTLLGARHVLFALTKIDRCDDVDAAVAAVRARLDGSPSRAARIIPVSARTGEGLPDLISALTDALATAGDAPDVDRPRVWLDRSFSIKGAGTVVTGTLSGGTLRPDDVVEIAPVGVKARIRQIQSHGKTRDVASPVSRVALNLAGVEVGQVTRGDAAVSPGRWEVPQVVDVELAAIEKITSRGAFKIHIGSAETDVRLTLLDASQIVLHQRALARLHLGRAIALQPGDRFVLRDTGRRATVGGGVILDVSPARRARGRVDALSARRDALASGTIAAAVLRDARRATPSELERWSGTHPDRAGAVVAGAHLYDPVAFDGIRERIVGELRAYHSEHPLVDAMPREVLTAASGLDEVTVSEVISTGIGAIAQGNSVRLAEHMPTLTPEDAGARTRLIEELSLAGFAPPRLGDTESSYGRELIGALIRSGDLTVIADMVWSRDVIESARGAIARAVAEEGPLTAARIKDVLGTTRKYAIPFLEYLDATGFTARNGDLREISQT